MSRRFHVAVIVDAASCSDRKILAGIAAYAKEAGNWSFYVEEDPRQRLPDFRSWLGDGIVANFQDRKVALAVRGLSVPVVEVGGGCGWYETASRIPYFVSDHKGIAALAVQHLVERGFHHLAYCGFPRTRHNRWSEERAAAFKAGRVRRAAPRASMSAATRPRGSGRNCNAA